MRFRTGVAGAACALVFSGAIALPAGAQTKDTIPKLEPTATAAEACSLIFGENAFTKAPSEGEVSPGEPVSVDVTWGSGFAKDSTVEVVGCTAVDNAFQEDLSTRIRRVKNDGLFVHEFTIPKTIAKGAKLCERAIVIGKTEAGAPKAERLDADCFTLASGTAPSKETAAAPKNDALAKAKVTKEAAAGPSKEAAAAPKNEALAKAKAEAAAPKAAAAPKPTTVAGATETKKSTAAAPAAPAGAKPAAAAAPAAASALARTGAGDRMMMVAAGLMLALGGLAVVASKPLRAVKVTRR